MELLKITMAAARLNAGLTQAEAAKAIGVSKSTLVSYEKGRSVPKMDTAKTMAAVYGCSVNQIIFLPNNCA
jgi:DNA-binding XRE family transcriptional regulator